MLVSAVVKVKPVVKVLVPAHLGQAAYGLFLKTVRSLDREMASRLHSGEGYRPFTVSSLLETGPSRGGEVLVKPDEEYGLRFTSIDPALSELLLSRLPNGLPSSISLDKLEYQVVGITQRATDYPWAGRESFDSLVRKHFWGERPAAKITLRFASPTTFRSGGHNIPIPLPRLVFASYLDKWNEFAGVPLGPDFKRFLEESVVVSRYQLRTRIVPIKKGLQVGCTGYCEYTALNGEEYSLRLMNLLADFAFWTGTGAKTTMGLGQTRRSK